MNFKNSWKIIPGDGGQSSDYLQGVETAEVGRREPSGMKEMLQIFSGVEVSGCIYM